MIRCHMSEDTEEFPQARYCLLGCGVSLAFDQGLGSVYVMMGGKEIRTQERTQEQWYIQALLKQPQVGGSTAPAPQRLILLFLHIPPSNAQSAPRCRSPYHLSCHSLPTAPFADQCILDNVYFCAY